jgi:hypothetical protein
VLFTFYDFPAEHWLHLRTSNPIAKHPLLKQLETLVLPEIMDWDKPFLDLYAQSFAHLKEFGILKIRSEELQDSLDHLQKLLPNLVVSPTI